MSLVYEDQIEYRQQFDVKTTIMIKVKRVHRAYLVHQIGRLWQVAWDTPSKLFFLTDLGEVSGHTGEEIASICVAYGMIPPNIVLLFNLAKDIFLMTVEIPWERHPLRLFYETIGGLRQHFTDNSFTQAGRSPWEETPPPLSRFEPGLVQTPTQWFEQTILQLEECQRVGEREG